MTQKAAAELRLKYQLAANNLRNAEAQLCTLSFQRKEIEEALAVETEKTENYRLELDSVCHEIASKSSEIDELKRQIEAFASILNDSAKSNSATQLLQSEAVRQFRLVFTAKGCPIGSQQWNMLHETIERLFPTFFETINKSGRLSYSDEQLCMLVKAGFTPSEIDFIMSKKHSYASNARKRLHSTIFGCPGSADDFDKKIRLVR